MSHHDLLGKTVTIWPGYDFNKRTQPVAEGVVVGIIESPSLVIRRPDGSTTCWSVNLPRDVQP